VAKIAPRKPSASNGDNPDDRYTPKTPYPAANSGTSLASADSRALAATEGGALGATEGEALAATEGGALGATEGEALAATEGGALGATEGEALAATEGGASGPTSALVGSAVCAATLPAVVNPRLATAAHTFFHMMTPRDTGRNYHPHRQR
jgi:hypothetical protein